MHSFESSELLETRITAWKIVSVNWPKSIEQRLKLDIPNTYFLRVEDAMDEADSIVEEFTRFVGPDIADSKIVVKIEPSNTYVRDIMSSLAVLRAEAADDIGCSDIFGAEPNVLFDWVESGGDEANSTFFLDRIRLTYETPYDSPEEETYGLPYDDFSYHCPSKEIIMLVEIGCSLLNHCCKRRDWLRNNAT